MKKILTATLIATIAAGSAMAAGAGGGHIGAFDSANTSQRPWNNNPPPKPQGGDSEEHEIVGHVLEGVAIATGNATGS